MTDLPLLSKFIVALTFICSLTINAPNGHADNRRLLTHSSPTYLFAVGKLQVPSQRQTGNDNQHFIENCSATLIDDHRAQLTWLLSAWHCFENYHNLGRPILLHMQDSTGKAYQRQVHIVKHGQSMQQDWALLRTDIPLPRTLSALEMGNYSDGKVSIAGYSGDSHLGQDGAVLTYEENCSPSENTLDPRQHSVSCTAYKGASGGAVIQAGRIVGIISQGDNQGTASFVSHATYADHVARYIP